MLNIRLDGKKLLLDTLKAQKAKITDYREYFEDYVTPALYKRFDDIFKKQGAVSGSRWQRLRLSTILEKKRKGFRPEILRRTDKLYKAYTGQGSGQINIRPKSLTYKNLVGYGVYHEEGRGVPKRTVIARLLAYKEFHNDIEDGMSKYLESD